MGRFTDVTQFITANALHIASNFHGKGPKRDKLTKDQRDPQKAAKFREEAYRIMSGDSNSEVQAQQELFQKRLAASPVNITSSDQIIINKLLKDMYEEATRPYFDTRDKKLEAEYKSRIARYEDLLEQALEQLHIPIKEAHEMVTGARIAYFKKAAKQDIIQDHLEKALSTYTHKLHPSNDQVETFKVSAARYFQSLHGIIKDQWAGDFSRANQVEYSNHAREMDEFLMLNGFSTKEAMHLVSDAEHDFTKHLRATLNAKPEYFEEAELQYKQSDSKIFYANDRSLRKYERVIQSAAKQHQANSVNSEFLNSLIYDLNDAARRLVDQVEANGEVQYILNEIKLKKGDVLKNLTAPYGLGVNQIQAERFVDKMTKEFQEEAFKGRSQRYLDSLASESNWVNKEDMQKHLAKRSHVPAVQQEQQHIMKLLPEQPERVIQEMLVDRLLHQIYKLHHKAHGENIPDLLVNYLESQGVGEVDAKFAVQESSVNLGYAAEQQLAAQGEIQRGHFKKQRGGPKQGGEPKQLSR